MRFFNIGDIDAIDFGALAAMLPGRQRWNPLNTQGRYINAILRSEKTLKEYEINSGLRLAHFLGQILIESNFLRATTENLNYSFATLERLFGHKFGSSAEIRAYAGKPEKIANRIYADRMGNGPEASGDGWRFAAAA